MEELRIYLYGRVQGVGFRQFAKKQADELRLNGYVRNTEDGRLIVVAQGSRLGLEKFLRVIQYGPLFAKVSNFSYSWKEAVTKYNEFVILLDKGFIEDQAMSFTNLGRNLLDTQKAVPRHICIIPDGNRRWAKERKLNIIEGHKASSSEQFIMALVNEGRRLGVKYLTFWGFSTENWNRDKREVDDVLNLVLKVIKKFRGKFIEDKVRFRHLGRKDRLPKSLVFEIEKLEKDTLEFNDYNVQLCLDYGGRDELTRAVNKMISNGVKEVSEQELARYLDTEGIPDHDLIIRTSGEKRTSGFMPFQSSYAELYFTDVKFPDFGPEELRKAVEEFSRRKRNFGK